MRYKSCPHTNENLYDSTRFAQTKFGKITVSDQFLSAVMDVHTSISLSNVFDIFAVWLNFGCVVEILIIKNLVVFPYKIMYTRTYISHTLDSMHE
jgi:hypothetical protein